MLLSKEMQARDEAQLPPTEAEAASGQPAGQYLNPPKQSGFKRYRRVHKSWNEVFFKIPYCRNRQYLI